MQIMGFSLLEKLSQFHRFSLSILIV
ncbi:hypothetical protein NC652_033870 [Populus alba x Populus x berolinensis]|nr:hypothetical protein NC652_033870 [Populus alba x Populus x berolinensis]